MRVSELNKDIIKNFCKEDYDDNDALIMSVMLPAAKAYICSYTGMSKDQLDGHEDITVALLVIVAEMYDNRRLTVDVDRVNPLAKGILDLHDNNLIGGAAYGET